VIDALRDRERESLCEKLIPAVTLVHSANRDSEISAGQSLSEKPDRLTAPYGRGSLSR
jgi:hypothetical protein